MSYTSNYKPTEKYRIRMYATNGLFYIQRLQNNKRDKEDIWLDLDKYLAACPFASWEPGYNPITFESLEAAKTYFESTAKRQLKGDLFYELPKLDVSPKD